MRVVGLLAALFKKACNALKWSSMIRVVTFIGETDEKELLKRTTIV
jgi:hypothetical protein